MALLTERPRPRVVREHPWAPWFAVATVCFGAFMGQLDASIVTLAFPAIQREFGAGLAGVQWVSLTYLLVLVAALVPVGRWSDRVGRKLVYLYGFLVFTLASAACGLTRSLAALVALRALQAVGAAMLQANSVALISTSVGAQARRRALGIQAAAQALGLTLGPTAGGLIIASTGWRWIFLINVPIGAAAIVGGWFLLPRTRDRAPAAGADPIGIVLLAAVSACVLLAISGLSGLEMSPWMVGALAAAAVLGLASLLRWERRVAAPVLDLRLLAIPAVARGCAGALLAYMVLFGPLVLFPQLHAGSGELRASFLLSALPAGFGLAAVASERVLPLRWPDRRRSTVGGSLAAVAALLLTVASSSGATVVLLGLLGAGLGMYLPANNCVIMSAVPHSTSAVAGGMINMARGLGTALGVTVVTLALHAHVDPMAALAFCAVAAMLTTATVGASGNRPATAAADGGRRAGSTRRGAGRARG